MNQPQTWMVHDVPVAGDPALLLARQAQMLVPGKLIRQARLRLDVPMRQGRPPHASLLHTILAEWHADTRAADLSETLASPESTDNLDDAGAALTGAGISWIRVDDRLEWSVSIGTHRYRCRAAVRRSWLRIQCGLLSLDAASPACRTALVHYLVELNGRIPGCRASLTERQLTVETLLWADELEGLLPIALAALHRAASIARDGTLWLQRDEVLSRYLTFHGLGKGGENHDDSDSRLVPLARGR
jgi:hypothetical protein